MTALDAWKRRQKKNEERRALAHSRVLHKRLIDKKGASVRPAHTPMVKKAMKPQKTNNLFNTIMKVFSGHKP